MSAVSSREPSSEALDGGRAAAVEKLGSCRPSGASPVADYLLGLQRAAGNSAVTRLLRTSAAMGHSRHRTLARDMVTISSPGFDDSPDEVLGFFQRRYDPDEHLRRAMDVLGKFSGVGAGHRVDLRDHFRWRLRRQLEGLRSPDAAPEALMQSLATMSTLRGRVAMPLAASFVIGIRERSTLLENRGMRDSFYQSGLDYLHPNQEMLRTEGFLPPDLVLPRGAHYDEPNPESPPDRPRRLRSARVEAGDMFLVHSALVASRASLFKRRALEFGFGESDIAALTDLQRNFWIALTFGGSGGSPWPDWRRRNRRTDEYGVSTVLSYLAAHDMPLGAVTRILAMDRFGTYARTRIAVRTAALVTALETMMHDPARTRAEARDSETEADRQPSPASP